MFFLQWSKAERKGNDNALKACSYHLYPECNIKSRDARWHMIFKPWLPPMQLYPALKAAG